MLKSYHTSALALAAGISLMAGAVQAETHIVTIFEGGYFPEVIYIDRGDSVQFENASGATHTVKGDGESWSSGEIANSGTFLLTLEEDTALDFSGIAADGLNTTGQISYDEPPLSNG